MDSLVFSKGGLTVSRNGVTISKPDWMSEDYWFKYEVPRVGKRYSDKSKGYLYGQDQPQAPTSGEDERGDGCDGGACSI